MVLIFSESNCQTTNEIVEWLKSFDCKVLRLNQDDPSTYLKYINILEDKIVVSNDQVGDVNILEAKSVWYRRRGISNKFVRVNIKKEQLDAILLEEGQSGYLTGNIKAEIGKILEYVYLRTEKLENAIGSHFTSDLNKMTVLHYANQVGLNIPATLVTNDKETARDFFYENNEGLITKAISDGIYHFAKDHAYYSYTEKVEKEHLSEDRRSWFHTLLQSQIKKTYEIRSFYFDDSFYSMAIFSQKNKQTEVDFRKYDSQKPNRTVPYQLPEETQNKLRRLFEKLNLNTGSVDLIADENGDYHFLEINPVGQFGMVSYPCNYELEKKVAKVLAYESNS